MLFAAGGDALIGPIDLTPVYLAGLLAAAPIVALLVAGLARIFRPGWRAAWCRGGVAGLACAGLAAAWAIGWILEAPNRPLSRGNAGAIGLTLGSLVLLIGSAWGIRWLVRSARRGGEIRLPQVRLTTRKWAVVILVVALLLWTLELGRRWLDYRRVAEAYAAQEALQAGQAAQSAANAAMYRAWVAEGKVARRPFEEAATETEKDAAAARAHAAEFARLRRKYEHAAAHPWLTIPPDAPVPR